MSDYQKVLLTRHKGLIIAYGYFAVLLLLQSICQRQLPQVARGKETSGEDQPDEGRLLIDSLIAKK